MNSILYILILRTSDIPKYTTANSITCTAKIKGKNVLMDLCITQIGIIFVQIQKRSHAIKKCLSICLYSSYDDVFCLTLTTHMPTLYSSLRFISPLSD